MMVRIKEDIKNNIDKVLLHIKKKTGLAKEDFLKGYEIGEVLEFTFDNYKKENDNGDEVADLFVNKVINLLAPREMTIDRNTKTFKGIYIEYNQDKEIARLEGILAEKGVMND